MIRGAGRLTLRMDERANYPTEPPESITIPPTAVLEFRDGSPERPWSFETGTHNRFSVDAVRDGRDWMVQEDFLLTPRVLCIDQGYGWTRGPAEGFEQSQEWARYRRLFIGREP